MQKRDNDRWTGTCRMCDTPLASIPVTKLYRRRETYPWWEDPRNLPLVLLCSARCLQEWNSLPTLD
jgi:hypothetical protein